MFKPDHPLLHVLQDGGARLNEYAQIVAHFNERCSRFQQHFQHKRGIFQMLSRSLHAADGLNIAAVTFEHTGAFEPQHKVIKRLLDRLRDDIPRGSFGGSTFELAHQNGAHAFNDLANGCRRQFAAEVIRGDFGKFVRFVKNHGVHTRQHPVVLTAFELHGRRRKKQMVIDDNDICLLSSQASSSHKAFTSVLTMFTETIAGRTGDGRPHGAVFCHAAYFTDVPRFCTIQKDTNTPKILHSIPRS